MPDGAEITYATHIEKLKLAIHQWFDAQLSDHARHAVPGLLICKCTIIKCILDRLLLVIPETFVHQMVLLRVNGTEFRDAKLHST